MNDRYLFRGKRVDSNGWVSGYYCVDRKKKHLIYPNDYSAHYNARDFVYECFEVDPTTVGQYIGMKDRNGTKIYEGDVVQTYFSFNPGDAGYGVSQKPFVVAWEQVRMAFRARKPNTDDWHLLDTIDFYEMQACVYEVIGNVHDNPELLKGDGDE